MFVLGADGQQQELPDERVQELVDSGVLDAKVTLAWRPGMPDWVAVGQLLHGCEWSYSADGKVLPASDVDMVRLAGEPDTFVWRAGMTEWRKVSNVPDFPRPYTDDECGGSASSGGAEGASGESKRIESPTDGGEGEASASGASVEAKPSVQEKTKKRKRKKKGGWVQAKTNTWVYFQGLPQSASIDDVATFFAKCGLIQQLTDGSPRVKLYETKDGKRKDDGSVCYVRPESVELAVTLLDGADIAPGCPLKVTPASFSKKDNVDPKAARAASSSQALKLRKMAAKQALSWNEDGMDDSSADGLRIVVLKHLFAPDDFKDPTFGPELQEDVGEELSKLGTVEKITLFERNPDGVAVVKFGSPAAAEACVKLMHGRWFAKRKLNATYWDGKTDYRVKMSEEDEQRRIKEFGDWLEEGDPDDDEDEAPPPHQSNRVAIPAGHSEQQA